MNLRILKLITVVLFLFFVGTSCQKNNESDELNNSLIEVSGVIGFDEINQQYFINIYTEGTIDEIITAYPSESLPEEFRTVNLKVIVSGELYNNNNQIKPVLGGQQIYSIKIKQIRIV